MKKWILMTLFSLPLLGSPALYAAETPTADTASSSVDAEYSAAAVDVNTADAETLADRLIGIGAAKAKAIVAYRNQHGPFAGPEDLLAVKGIGPVCWIRTRGG